MDQTTAESLQPLLPLLAQMLGKRPSPATLWRWHKVGIKVGDDRVRLEAKRVGGQLYGSVEAVERFIQAQNPPIADSTEESEDRSPDMEQKLQAAGML